MRPSPWLHAALIAALAFHPACASSPPRPGAGEPAPPANPKPAGTRWKLVHHETFDAPFAEPKAWVEDRYGDDSPYHVDAYDEDGEFFRELGGPRFLEVLLSFTTVTSISTFAVWSPPWQRGRSKETRPRSSRSCSHFSAPTRRIRCSGGASPRSASIWSLRP